MPALALPRDARLLPLPARDYDQELRGERESSRSRIKRARIYPGAVQFREHPRSSIPSVNPGPRSRAAIFRLWAPLSYLRSVARPTVAARPYSTDPHYSTPDWRPENGILSVSDLYVLSRIGLPDIASVDAMVRLKAIAS